MNYQNADFKMPSKIQVVLRILSADEELKRKSASVHRYSMVLNPLGPNFSSKLEMRTLWCSLIC